MDNHGKSTRPMYNALGLVLAATAAMIQLATLPQEKPQQTMW